MRLTWLAGLALVLSGCGLADYEKRMEKAQADLQRYEEENRLLDKPVYVPSQKDKGPLANVFFRPPRGISSTAANENDPRGGLLYSYLPRYDRAAGPFNRVELAFGGEQKEFTADVLKALNCNQTATRQRTVNVPWRKTPLTFDTVEFEDERNFYSVNVWTGPRSKVAIVYGLAKEQRTAGNRTMELSLASLAVDGEVKARRDALEKGPLDSVPGPPPS